MIKRIRDAHLIAPLLATLAGMALLIGLGNWQLTRKAWKEDLIHGLETRAKAPPVSLDEAVRRFKAGADVEYLRVRAEGRFDHSRERYLYAPSANEGPGYHVYTPLVVIGLKEGGAGTRPALAARTLLVNRGYVPEAKKSPETRRSGQINDDPIEIPAESYHRGAIKGAVVVGLLRKSEVKGRFTPDNDANANLWYWRDLKGMAKTLISQNCDADASGGAGCETLYYPFFLDQEVSDVPGGWPRGGTTNINLPNRHLEYAFTWFGLAAALAGVFAAFAMQRLRRGGKAGS